MFVTVPTPDLDRSADFWTRGLGFVNLFCLPQQLIHLRRWAFQDVLLVPGEADSRAAKLSVSFACVRSQIESLHSDCQTLLPGASSGPLERPWNSTELEITTPEGTLVVMTAANAVEQKAWPL